MSATQRSKGQRGEREFCAALRDHLGEAFTRQLYRCFGLSEAQAEAKLAGDSLRDILNEIVLMAIYQAEIEAALWIASRIDAKELRKVIKAGLKSIFEKHAAQCSALQSMARVAA